MSAPKRATALRYQAGAQSPEVVATGTGALAERILARAQDAGVPVREDPALAAALAGLDLGQDVPQELWIAVAEVLAWAYALDRAGRSY